MSEHKIDVMWDDAPVDVSTEVNFIWSIANKLRGTYQSDKYKDVIIPMVIIRRLSVLWTALSKQLSISTRRILLILLRLCAEFQDSSSSIQASTLLRSL